MVVGPFEMETQELDMPPPFFFQALEPEKNWDIATTYLSGSNTIGWQEEEVEENGWMNFGTIYDEDMVASFLRLQRFVLAYGLCYIQAPDDRKVLAYFWCEFFSKILIDGEEVHSVEHPYAPKYFILPLNKGWNTVIVKCALHATGWRYTLKVADANKELKFYNRRP